MLKRQKKPGTEVVYLDGVAMAVIVEGTPHDEAIKEIVNETHQPFQPDADNSRACIIIDCSRKN